jgi:hypothetical protein
MGAVGRGSVWRGGRRDLDHDVPVPAEPARPGPALWSSPGWLDGAVAWLDDRLAAAGIERTGPVEQPRVRPWATVLRAPTTGGDVWLKAAGPGTAFEVGLYELLARVVPDRVLAPLAVDVDRSWIVLPDGGPPLAERFPDAARAEPLAQGLAAALVHYGRLQLDLAPHVDEMLTAGVPDMRPAVMPQRFAEALDATADPPDATGRATHERIAAMAPTVTAWCDELAASALPPSLDHNDLHASNVLGDDPATGDVRFYDWGDSVVAHPLATTLVPLGMVRHLLGATDDDPAVLRVRDAYLGVFRDAAPGEDLAATLELACHVAKIARALTWDRAVRAALDAGEEVPDEWATAALVTLGYVLDASYLGE